MIKGIHSRNLCGPGDGRGAYNVYPENHNHFHNVNVTHQSHVKSPSEVLSTNRHVRNYYEEGLLLRSKYYSNVYFRKLSNHKIIIFTDLLLDIWIESFSKQTSMVFLQDLTNVSPQNISNTSQIEVHFTIL